MKHSTLIQVLEKVLQKAQQGQPLGSFNNCVLNCTRFTKFNKILDKFYFRINDDMTMYLIKYYEEGALSYYISFIKDDIEVDYYCLQETDNHFYEVTNLFEKLQQIKEDQLDKFLAEFLNT